MGLNIGFGEKSSQVSVNWSKYGASYHSYV